MNDVKPKILLVEDEPGLVLTVSDRLRSEGYPVEPRPTATRRLSMPRAINSG